MELWLDTTDLDVIKHANKLNILTGVTTNPLLLSKAEADPETTIKKILDVQPGRVAVQVTEGELMPIIEQSRRLSKLSDRVIIKIPAINDGFHAISFLEKEGICTLATTIFETRQIIFSAMTGASYAAPYLSRIDQATGNATSVVGDGQEIIKLNNYKTKIMAASVTRLEQFIWCAKIEIGAITLPKNLYSELFSSNAVIEKCMDDFDAAWKSKCLNYKFNHF
jgi:TalC/MipB family fructose-6-phosphate aldolase